MRGFFSTSVFMAFVAVVLATPLEEAVAAQTCERQPVNPILVEASGSARLCVAPSNLKARMRVRGLVPGEAYTVWWIYIDDPTQCDGVCGFETFGGDNPLAVFGRLDSIVAPASGRATFSSELRGMRASPGAEVWFLVFGHGAAVEGRELARQLLTPEDPSAGTPHLGNIIDGPLGFPAADARFTVPQ